MLLYETLGRALRDSPDDADLDPSRLLGDFPAWARTVRLLADEGMHGERGGLWKEAAWLARRVPDWLDAVARVVEDVPLQGPVVALHCGDEVTWRLAVTAVVERGREFEGVITHFVCPGAEAVLWGKFHPLFWLSEEGDAQEDLSDVLSDLPVATTPPADDDAFALARAITGAQEFDHDAATAIVDLIASKHRWRLRRARRTLTVLAIRDEVSDLIERHIRLASETASATDGPQLVLVLGPDARAPNLRMLSVPLALTAHDLMAPDALDLANDLRRLCAVVGADRALSALESKRELTEELAQAWTQVRRSLGSLSAFSGVMWPGSGLARIDSPPSTPQYDARPITGQLWLQRSALEAVCNRLFTTETAPGQASLLPLVERYSSELSTLPAWLLPYRVVVDEQLVACRLDSSDPATAKLNAKRLCALLGLGCPDELLWERTLLAWPKPDAARAGSVAGSPRPTAPNDGSLLADAIADFDDNALRLADVLLGWFGEEQAEWLSDFGVTPSTGSAALGGLAPDDILSWLRPERYGLRQWLDLTQVADRIAELRARAQWRLSACAVPRGPGRPLRNAELAERCLREVLRLPDAAIQGPVSRLRSAIEALDGAPDALVVAFRSLEAVCAFVVMAMATLVPEVALALEGAWRRAKAAQRGHGKEASDSAPARTQAAHECRTSRTALQALAGMVRGRVTMGTVVTVLDVLSSDALEPLVRSCVGSSDMTRTFRELIELRNATVHNSGDELVRLSTARHRLKLLLTDESFWASLPVLAKVVEERASSLGSVLVYETELGHRVAAPTHLVDGRRWHRGELIHEGFLLVARGPANGSRPLAVRVRNRAPWPDLMRLFVAEPALTNVDDVRSSAVGASLDPEPRAEATQG